MLRPSVSEKVERFYMASVIPGNSAGNRQSWSFLLQCFPIAWDCSIPNPFWGLIIMGSLCGFNVPLCQLDTITWIRAEWLTINSRRNERCLSSCGYCAPDQDRGINTVCRKPKIKLIETVQKHRNIIQQRKDATKWAKLLQAIWGRMKSEIEETETKAER